MSHAAVASEPTTVQPRLREVLTLRQVFILCIGLVSATANYMLLPFFVIYYHHALGFSTALSGLLVGIPFLSALLFGVIGGALADRLGALRASAVAMTVYGLCVGGVGLLHQPLAIGLVMGVAGMMMPVMSGGISSLLNQSAPAEHRGLLQNALYWMSNLGIILGLLISADLLHGGHSTVPFFVICGLRIVLALVLTGFAGLRTSRSGAPVAQASDTASPKSSRPTLLSALRVAATDRALLFAALTMLALMVMESQVDSVVPIDLTAHFHNGSQIFGPLVAINAVVVVIAQPLCMKWGRKKPPVPFFAAGALLTGCGLALGGIVGTIPAWVVGMLMYSFGETLFGIKLNALLGELPLPGNATLYFTTIITAQNLAFFLGTSGGSTLYAVVGPTTLFSGLITVAILSVLLFRLAVSAYGRRTAMMASNVGVVADFPGVERVDDGQAESLANGGQDDLPAIQGATALLPRPTGEPLLGVSPQTERLVLLERLSAEQWGRLLDETDVLTFEPGDMVLRAGESDRSLYLVQKGRLEVLAPGQSGEGPALTTVEAGSVFGEQAFVDGQQRSASVRAIATGELRRLHHDAFLRLSQTDPVLAQMFLTDLARVLSERLRRTTQFVNLMHA